MLVFNPRTQDYEMPGEAFGDSDDKTQPDAPPAIVPVPVESVAAMAAGRLNDTDRRGVVQTAGSRASGDVLSAHSLLKAADLEWDPVIVPLKTAEGFDVPGHVGRAVVRSDNRAPIGTVGGRYHVIPHRKLADLADALIGANRETLHYGNAGYKHDGARPFIQLRGAPRSVGGYQGFAVEIEDLITLMTGHDGTLEACGVFGTNVIECCNTYAHALSAARSKGFRIRHTATSEGILDTAIDIAKAARDNAAAFDNAALRLMVKRMTDADMGLLCSALVPGEGKRAENARTAIMEAYHSAPAAKPGTAWGAAQAVTHYTTHTIPTRGETDRGFALATGEGSGADMQAKAWWHLTEEEGIKALQTVKLYRV